MQHRLRLVVVDGGGLSCGVVASGSHCRTTEDSRRRLLVAGERDERRDEFGD